MKNIKITFFLKILYFFPLALWGGPSLYGDKYKPIFQIEIREKKSNDAQEMVNQLLNALEETFSIETSENSINANKYRTLISKKISIEKNRNFIIEAEIRSNTSPLLFCKRKLDWTVFLSYNFNCWYPDENNIVDIDLDERNYFLSFFNQIDEYIITQAEKEDFIIKKVREKVKIF